MQQLDSYLNRAARVLWALTLLTLPVTSFRFFPFFGKETLVRPLSLYPLVLLLPVLVFIFIRSRKQLWKESFLPLLIFILIAALTSVIAAFYAPLDFRSNDYWGRVIRAWLSLAIGLSFFLGAIWSNRSKEDMQFTLKWLYIGLVINLSWGMMQTSSVFFNFPSKQVADTLQEIFSMRGLVRSARISGLAFEPSWMSGQLLTLYFPWLFASIIQGYHVSRFRWLELVLFGWAMALNLLSYSRSGIVLVVFVSAITYLLFGQKQIRAIWDWFKTPRTSKEKVVRVVTIVTILALLSSAGTLLARRNYFAQLWNAEATSLQEYFTDAYAGARFAYTLAGWNIFEQYPLTGVGLGASGLYMHDTLPIWSLGRIPEVARLTSPASNVYLNPKNIFSRLLAETGFFGFIAYVFFYLYILAKIIEIRNKNPLLATAGFFIWLAVIMHGLTQDSFAMPNTWISFGLLLGLINQDNTQTREE